MTIPTEDDVLKHQSHYIDRLATPDSDELLYILYNYGPYLLTHNDITRLRDSISYDTNPIYAFLVDAVFILTCGNGALSIREAKSQISSIMANCPVTNEYTAKIKELCEQALTDIKNYQYTDKLLESAVLNFAPIVEYQGVIVKPGMETGDVQVKPTDAQDSHSLINMIVSILRGTKDEMVSRLNAILVNDIQVILANTTDFVHIDNFDGQYKMIDAETGIPSDVLRLLTKYGQCNSNSTAMVYYILSHFIFGYDIDTVHEFSDKLEKLGLSVNGILNGERIDVTSVMESLSTLTLPSIKDTMYSINAD